MQLHHPNAPAYAVAGPVLAEASRGVWRRVGDIVRAVALFPFGHSPHGI